MLTKKCYMSLTSLLNDILGIIISHLSISDILNLRMTCTILNKYISTRNKFWFVHFYNKKYVHEDDPRYANKIEVLLNHIKANKSTKVPKYKNVLRAITINKCDTKLIYNVKLPFVQCFYPFIIPGTVELNEKIEEISVLTMAHSSYEIWKKEICDILRNEVFSSVKYDTYVMSYCRSKYLKERFPNNFCLNYHHYDISITTKMTSIDILDDKFIPLYDSNINYLKKYVRRSVKNRLINKYSSVPKPEFFKGKINNIRIEIEALQKEMNTSETFQEMSCFLDKSNN